MTVKPIDIQTNMAQMLEVGKGEHAKQGAVAEQQHLLHKESKDKSNLVGNKLDELKEGEKTSIRDEDKKGDRKGQGGGGEKQEKTREQQSEKIKDERMGNLIDVFK
jgi:hypothetical protein